MTTQPAHDALDRRPFWQVQGVFDPDGGGGDFAYTIGLAERGCPELHLWARPSLGEDPGEDWILSMRDRCRILNELAWLLLDGRLCVGDTLDRVYDDGLATVRFRVDPLEDREQLEAFGVPPGVDVLPVRWSLTRAPAAPLVELSVPAEEKARATYAELRAGTDRRFRAPVGWALPDAPDFAPTQRFGPLTPLVLARAAVLWQADRDRLHKLLVVAMQADGAGSLTEPISVARAVARPVGRSAALDAVESAVQQLVTDRMCDSRFATCWHDAVAGVWGQELLWSPPAERLRIQRNLRGLLIDMLHACCAVQAVDDVIDAPARLAGLGPWLALTTPDGVAPDAAWQATPDVLAVVRRLLSGLSDAQLDQIMHTHSAVLMGLPGFTTPREEYADVEALLSGWALTSAAACPDLGRLLGRKWAHRDGLALWASCLTAALTFRARLSADQVSAFCKPFRQLLPTLEPTLNAVHQRRPCRQRLH